MIDEVKQYLEAVVDYEVAVDGDSDDAELEAGNVMRDAGIALVRVIAGRDIAVAELLDAFDNKADDPLEEDEED
jgi:hypothetical protein